MIQMTPPVPFPGNLHFTHSSQTETLAFMFSIEVTNLAHFHLERVESSVTYVIHQQSVTKREMQNQLDLTLISIHIMHVL